MSFFIQELILLRLAIEIFCQFIYIIIALNKLITLEVKDIFFIFIKSYRYNPNWKQLIGKL